VGHKGGHKGGQKRGFQGGFHGGVVNVKTHLSSERVAHQGHHLLRLARRAQVLRVEKVLAQTDAEGRGDCERDTCT
jgi:hypothetical protein